MPDAGKMISMTMSDGAAVGVYHVEARGPRRGGLVLIQEIFGVTEHIREQCDAYAAEGYEVLAPALFDREAPGLQASYSPEDRQMAIRIMRELHPFDLSVADTQTCIDQLKGKGPIFIIGYCYGGSVTWAAACRCNGLSAASAYYGSMIPRLSSETPRCPVILHFGRHDQSIPLEGIDQVKALHPEVEVHVYDAGHGFNSDRRSDYHEESARLARQCTLALFRAHGG
ncbi:MAG TPA: dienelactone hydrolase family protein [Noviherbaspirillum sp.]|uniref:dienelactone hydrolase family protein n=1 Tax=Noviherbaspirillum sp. TaxID=1926288 RepID=UPI002B460157|nr:dienelactone hydrolase family protein [Noviherbaspirillum sp.]HJV86206.1 dienelactone hydrolase family protein [Noviherbaspirillum sp.]